MISQKDLSPYSLNVWASHDNNSLNPLQPTLKPAMLRSLPHTLNLYLSPSRISKGDNTHITGSMRPDIYPASKVQ